MGSLKIVSAFKLKDPSTWFKFKAIPSDSTPQASAYQTQSRWGNLYGFDGEKTPFTLGSPLAFQHDYYAMRLRAWELYLKTDFVQNAIRKYCLWVVGSGLKLQSEPSQTVLEMNNINVGDNQLKEFVKQAEESFRLFASNTDSSYNRNDTLHDLASEALKNAIMAGDCLVVSRFDGNKTTLEVIDGGAVCDPIGNDFFSQAKNRGNRIIKGVELDKKGTHIAYYVRQDTFKYVRVIARGTKTGRLQAWLMYGLRGKLNDVRGLSLLGAIMETATKMDRYKEASIGSAEQNAKIAFSIEHGSNSDGENPLEKQIAQSFGKGMGTAPETKTDSAEDVATKIAQTTNQTAYNLPIDSKLVKHAGGGDVNFDGFYKPNIEIVYATIGIPPEVAADKFGGAYSGSRAALKSWEYKMTTDRITILKRRFYQPFYIYWLDHQVLKNKIQPAGYLLALNAKNTEVLNAYRKSRFIGAGVPHIDPVKEANAERIKLGKNMINMPLTSTEQAMENLGTGDVDAMIKKVRNEKDMADDLLEVPVAPVPANSSE